MLQAIEVDRSLVLRKGLCGINRQVFQTRKPKRASLASQFFSQSN